MVVDSEFSAYLKIDKNMVITIYDERFYTEKKCNIYFNYNSKCNNIFTIIVFKDQFYFYKSALIIIHLAE